MLDSDWPQGVSMTVQYSFEYVIVSIVTIYAFVWQTLYINGFFFKKKKKYVIID